ncbi:MULTISPECIES: integrase [Pseudomonas]|uniref:integrase n=1 Tax=Pseudomonas TaxID=286 RepID=UPI000AC46916|nr:MULTISPECIES: integrase [Pseudomonas]
MKAYDELPTVKNPTFHETRAIGAWLYKQQRFEQEFMQGLMGHADEKMPEHYHARHGEDEMTYMKVKADLIFEKVVRFSKSFPTFFQTPSDKKGLSVSHSS